MQWTIINRYTWGTHIEYIEYFRDLILLSYFKNNTCISCIMYNFTPVLNRKYIILSDVKHWEHINITESTFWKQRTNNFI